MAEAGVVEVPNRAIAAAVMIGVFALIIGYIDNYVRVIAAEIGLWQFQALRSALMVPMLVVAVPLMRLRLRPVAPRAVLARSLVHATGMLLYFGALAFLPVAQVAAGLFSAPFFVLLIQRLAYGQPISPVSALSVALGFVGILLVLGPGAGGSIGLASLMPVAGGAFYAMGNIATRAWCPRESVATLTAGYMAALGLMGLAGMAVLALLAPEAAAGADGFLTRSAAWPSAQVWFWVAVQSAGSLIGVGLLVRGYQLTEARQASVFEYSVLPAAALWGWLLWGQVPGPAAAAGMALIVAAGVLIALRGR
ncbi:MAG: DMT family transporter [Phaeovulum sp.]|uniref:DMT family transporter n=1 Tax=Phaeovulum sp. TaxID=2934796 RepID=UPI0027321C22|nr:DMT family transporter [Phaeovulum sp.]MDP2062005.1 DMT family transporter [Phaeovulum sp.]